VRRLTAYLVPSPGAAPAGENVRAALERQLPRNMVPTFFVWLDAMPMTPNGKLDRKALPAPSREEALCPTNRLPETRMEHEIAGIWEDLLQVSPIGVGSDFFDLGGDSLSLINLFATIEAQFGRHLTVDVLSGGLTVAGLAQMLAGDEPPRAEMDPVVALQPLGRRPPFFCVHGIGGDVVHLHRLAMHMGTDRPFFGLRRTPQARHPDTIGQLAARYVAAMLVHQPAGPFYLGGHSFGATVAYEMALQLVEQGHEIGLLAIIDQRRPGWRLTARDALPVLHRILARIPARISDELAQVPATDRFRQLRRTLSRWSKAALGYRADAKSMFDLSRSETEQIRLFEGNLRALQDYKATTPLPVPITLFRANMQSLSPLCLGFDVGLERLGRKRGASPYSTGQPRIHSHGAVGPTTGESIVRGARCRARRITTRRKC